MVPKNWNDRTMQILRKHSLNARHFQHARTYLKSKLGNGDESVLGLVQLVEKC